jgi:hypothetical protein
MHLTLANMEIAISPRCLIASTVGFISRVYYNACSWLESVANRSRRDSSDLRSFVADQELTRLITFCKPHPIPLDPSSSHLQPESAMGNAEPEPFPPLPCPHHRLLGNPLVVRSWRTGPDNDCQPPAQLLGAPTEVRGGFLPLRIEGSLRRTQTHAPILSAPSWEKPHLVRMGPTASPAGRRKRGVVNPLG